MGIRYGHGDESRIYICIPNSYMNSGAPKQDLEFGWTFLELVVIIFMKLQKTCKKDKNTRCRNISHFKIYLMVIRYETLMRGPESIKYMHMIHCICLNRAQQWPTAVCLLFSAASEGRVKKFGTCKQNWDFFGTKLELWSHLGPSPEFGTFLERLHYWTYLAFPS